MARTVRSRSRKNIVLDFRQRHPAPWSSDRKRFGSNSILSPVEPYQGPATFELSGTHRGHDRRFHIVHVSHSPTGSAHGSFRIDELLPKHRVTTHGYWCSYPSFNDCIRVVNSHTEQ